MIGEKAEFIKIKDCTRLDSSKEHRMKPKQKLKV